MSIEGLLPRWPGRPRRVGPRPNTSRILIIGDEQAASIGRAMANLAPEASLAFLSTAIALRRYRTVKRLRDACERYDAAFVSADLPALRDGGTIAELGGHARIMRVPRVTFAAFHPDLVRIASGTGAPILGPMGPSHSALVLFGYCAGLPQEAVAGLFHHDVFRRVGYFDAWDAAANHLHDLGARAGYDLQASLVRWARRGCFMHGPDHLRLHAVADLARGLLDRVGIPHYTCNLEDHLSDDPGGMGSWPVYPEIAAHYGVPGSALFLRPDAYLDTRDSPTLSLTAFVAESYATYARFSTNALVCPRVAAWRADGDLSSTLQDVAIHGKQLVGTELLAT